MGELSRLKGSGGFDRVDNVLLELILATALREEPAAAVQVGASPDHAQAFDHAEAASCAWREALTLRGHARRPCCRC